MSLPPVDRVETVAAETALKALKEMRARIEVGAPLVGVDGVWRHAEDADLFFAILIFTLEQAALNARLIDHLAGILTVGQVNARLAEIAKEYAP